jgi:hypothetical protein
MHLWLNTLFIDHTYMFRSPSATILRVYSIKECNKNLCGESVQDFEFIKCYTILKLFILTALMIVAEGDRNK